MCRNLLESPPPPLTGSGGVMAAMWRSSFPPGRGRDTFRDTCPKNAPFRAMPKTADPAFIRVRGRMGFMAEGVGFEPTETCASPVFKTGAINRSTTPPCCGENTGAPRGWQASRTMTLTPEFSADLMGRTGTRVIVGLARRRFQRTPSRKSRNRAHEYMRGYGVP